VSPVFAVVNMPETGVRVNITEFETMLRVELEFKLVFCQEIIWLLKKLSAPVFSSVGVYQIARSSLNARGSQRTLFRDGINEHGSKSRRDC
jgi:hypothetical protein